MKNEKVTLVFFAYIIGFTTAFIAFAINDNKYSDNDIVAYEDHSEIVKPTNHNPVLQNQSALKIVEKPEGLFIQNGSQERVLSATAIDGVSGEGFHTEIFASSVSPNGQYVYFCASLVGEQGICANFVYGVTDDLVYRVKVGEESLKTTEEEAGTASWVSNDTLKFFEGSASMGTNWTIR